MGDGGREEGCIGLKKKAHLLKGEQPAAAHLHTLNRHGASEFTKSFHTYTGISKRRMGGEHCSFN